MENLRKIILDLLNNNLSGKAFFFSMQNAAMNFRDCDIFLR